MVHSYSADRSGSVPMEWRNRGLLGIECLSQWPCGDIVTIIVGLGINGDHSGSVGLIGDHVGHDGIEWR
jgi:hypothetical protein